MQQYLFYTLLRPHLTNSTASTQKSSKRVSNLLFYLFYFRYKDSDISIQCVQIFTTYMYYTCIYIYSLSMYVYAQILFKFTTFKPVLQLLQIVIQYMHVHFFIPFNACSFFIPFLFCVCKFTFFYSHISVKLVHR